MRVRQQARPADRRERHGRQQLGVVGQAVARVGVGPGIVEHILAARVAFGIERHRAGQQARAAQGQEAGRPAGAWTGASGIVQRPQEGMAHERLRAGQRIPLGRIEVVQAGLHREFDRGGHGQ
ncbi:hypothetical protein DK45_3459 [Bordetella bronchiseptica]|nr:hypothetical protein DK45_3459 [Bordetella bronchiseptica]